MSSASSRPPWSLLFVLVLACGGLAVRSAAAVEPLALRINDADVRQDETAVLVLRTYAPRPISQGQLLLRAAPAPGAAARVVRGLDGQGKLTSGPSPFLSIVDVKVVSSEGYLVPTALSLTPDGQGVMFDFFSAAATVNVDDGPLAILELELSPDVVPGQVFTVSPVLDQSWLEDAVGNSIVIDPRPGELTILPSTAPLKLQMDRLEVMSGTTAVVELSSLESRPLSGATLTVELDPTVLAGPLTAVAGPLQGSADLISIEDPPGRLVVTVDSLDGQLNVIPGPLVKVYAPTVSGLAVGTRAPVVFAETTELIPVVGDPPDLLYEHGELLFVSDVVFYSGFESGDLTDWGQ